MSTEQPPADIPHRPTLNPRTRQPRSFEWQLHALCRRYPADVFFPDELRGLPRDACVREAKDICQACPVLAQCAEYALQTPETYGIWGAMTPQERVGRRRRRGLDDRPLRSPGRTSRTGARSSSSSAHQSTGTTTTLAT